MELKTYVFDIDHTIYRYSLAIENWLNQTIEQFIQNRLSINQAEARELRFKYYKTYGATYIGLNKFHNINANDFFSIFQKFPYEDIISSAKINSFQSINAKKIAFTNSPTSHGNKVLEVLGLKNTFDAVVGLDLIEYEAKPSALSFEHFFSKMCIDPTKAILFEDSANNLETAKEFGMVTCLIDPQTPQVNIKNDKIDITVFNLDEGIEYAKTL